MSANQRLVDLIKEIRNIKGLMDPNPYRTRAYNNLIDQILLLKEKLSEENLRTLDIGKKSKEKLGEYLRTGTIAEVVELRALLKRYRKFVKLHGFTPKRIAELFSEFGADLTPKTLLSLYNAGKADLTAAQVIALKYADTLKGVKVKYLWDIEKRLKTVTQKSLPKNIVVMMVGSYRRHKKEPEHICGDIDIIYFALNGKTSLTAMDITRVVDNVIPIVETLAEGKKKFMGIAKISKPKSYAHIDIFYVDDPVCGVVFGTGSGQFNIKLRSVAKKKGYKLNQDGLWDLQTNKKIQINSEKELLDMLIGYYIPPSKR